MTIEERLDRLELENRRLRRSLTGILVLAISAMGCLFLAAADKKAPGKPSGKKSKDTIDTSKYDAKPKPDEDLETEDTIVTKRLLVGDPDGAHIVLTSTPNLSIAMNSQDRKRQFMIADIDKALFFKMHYEGGPRMSLFVDESEANIILGKDQGSTLVLGGGTRDARVILSKDKQPKATVSTGDDGRTWLTITNGGVRIAYPSNRQAISIGSGYDDNDYRPGIELLDGNETIRASLFYDQKYDSGGTMLFGKNGKSRLFARVKADSPGILFMNESGEPIRSIEADEATSKSAPDDEAKKPARSNGQRSSPDAPAKRK